MKIEAAKNDNDIKWLEKSAYDIWHEWFPQMITHKQIDYMLNKFLSFDAIKQLIAEGCEFYILSDSDKRIGFTEIKRYDDDTLFLSKLYLFKEERGKGYAREAFEFLKSYAKDLGLKSIWLTVNKGNARAIAAYKKQEMEIIRSEVTDIGEGYVMDDYVFSLKIPQD